MLEKLKTRYNRSPVAASAAEKYAKKNGLNKYVECSANTRKVRQSDSFGNNERNYFQGLKEVFDEAVKIVLNKDKQQRPERRCRLL